MATIEFTMNMNCSVSRDDDADVFVSHCPALNIYSQGETEDEAVEAMKSAITMHITTAFDFNRLDKVLRRSGFEKFSSGKEAVAQVPPEAEFVEVRVRPEARQKQIPITLPLRLSAQQSQYAGAC